VLGQDLFEEAPELGEVPLPAPELVDEAALRLVRTRFEDLVEAGVRRLDAEVGREDEEGLADRVHDGLGVVAPLRVGVRRVPDPGLSWMGVVGAGVHRVVRCGDHPRGRRAGGGYGAGGAGRLYDARPAVPTRRDDDPRS